MHRSTPGNPPSDGELCRLAAEVFEALREAFDVDTWSERPRSPRDQPQSVTDPELAIIGMHCAHELTRR